MLWYLIICALMLYPYAIARAGSLSGRKTKHIALMTACVILWFFMAFRDISVGVDTKFYAYVFEQFHDIPLTQVFTAETYGNESQTWTFDFEPGYRLMNKLLSLFFTTPQAITVLNSTIIMVLWYFLIKDNSPNFLLSIWLVITLGTYQTQMNVTRNAIAILMVYNAFPLVRKGDLVRYCGVCVLASMFHVAALIFIPLYFVLRGMRLSAKRMIFAVAVFCLMGIVFPMIRPHLMGIFPSRFDQYLKSNNEKFTTLVVGVLNGGFFLLTMWLLPKKQVRKVFANERVGVLMLTLNLCFFGLNIGLGAASRMAALFGPYLVITIPRMLRLIEHPVARRRAAAVITVLSGVQYVLRMCINNIGGTLPYLFCW